MLLQLASTRLISSSLLYLMLCPDEPLLLEEASKCSVVRLCAILLALNSNRDADTPAIGGDVSIVMARFLIFGGNGGSHPRRGIFKMYPFFHLPSLVRIGRLHTAYVNRKLSVLEYCLGLREI